MGFLELVPAERVTALYLVQKHMLLLQASGTVASATSGIKFDRQPFQGGLKFVLEGWTGPLTGETEKYDVELQVPIQLPNPATPSAELIVVTANHAGGLKVPIRFDGLIVTLNPIGPGNVDEPRVAQETPAQGPPLQTAHIPGEEQINTLFKTSFTIKENSVVPSLGSVKVKYDDTFLVLQSADIESSNIVWTFSSLKTGTTQVIVTVDGGIATFIQIKTYNVHVFLPGLGENQGGSGEAQVAVADK